MHKGSWIFYRLGFPLLEALVTRQQKQVAVHLGFAVIASRHGVETGILGGVCSLKSLWGLCSGLSDSVFALTGHY